MAKNGKVCVIRINSPEGTKSQVLNLDKFTLGRSADATLSLTSPGISRVHLEVTVKGDEIWLQDLGSANGTLISGKKIPSKTQVQYSSGDPVQLGTSGDSISFELIEKPQELKTKSMDHFTEDERASIVEVTASAERDAERIRKAAQDHAQMLKDESKKQVNLFMEESRKKASEILDKAHAEASKMIKEARLSVTDVKLNTEKEAEHLLKEAHVKASEIRNNAEEKSEALLRETKHKVMVMIQETEAEAEKILKQTRVSASEIRANAEKELDTAKARGQVRADEIVASAQIEFRKITEMAKQDADKIRAAAMEEGRKQGLQFIKQSESDAEEALKRRAQTEDEIRSLEKQKLEYRADIEVILREKGDTEDLLKRAKEEVLHAESQAKKSKELIEFEVYEVKNKLRDHEAEVQKVVLAKEEAERLRDEAVRVMHEAEEKTKEAALQRQKALEEEEQIRREAQTLKNEEARSIREMRDKELGRLNERKKQEEDYIANMRLQEVEAQKARRVDEEKQRKARQANYILEISRNLELMLVPKVKDALKGKEVNFTEFSTQISSIVETVIHEETFTTSATLEQLGTNSVSEYDKKRRKKIFKWSAIGASAVVAFVFIFFPKIPQTALTALKGLNRDGETAAQVYVKDQGRKNEALRFDPKQSDEYKETYTDNVLYTRNFDKIIAGKEFHDKKVKDIDKFLREELKLDEETVVRVVASEETLVSALKRMKKEVNPKSIDEGIKKMRDLEEERVSSMKDLLQGSENYEKYQAKMKSFYAEIVPRIPASKDDSADDE